MLQCFSFYFSNAITKPTNFSFFYFTIFFWTVFFFQFYFKIIPIFNTAIGDWKLIFAFLVVSPTKSFSLKKRKKLAVTLCTDKDRRHFRIHLPSSWIKMVSVISFVFLLSNKSSFVVVYYFWFWCEFWVGLDRQCNTVYRRSLSVTLKR